MYDGLDPDDDGNGEEEGREMTLKLQATVDTLSRHFEPQVNVPFEHHLFKQMTPVVGESILKYIARLKFQAKNCKFSDCDDQIRDQMIHTVKSEKLRRKLLESGKDLTLTKLKEIAMAFEAIENQMASMSISEVNKVSLGNSSNKTGSHKTGPKDNHKGNGNSRPNSKAPGKCDNQCYRCGQSGHFAKDKCCPALSKTCNN